MPPLAVDATRDLPPAAARAIQDVVDDATRSLGTNLRSIILFGSAAENRLRPTSDVNVLIVVTAFDPAGVDRMRPTLQASHAAVRMVVMWLLEDEIAAAGDAFAVKFADITRRHRVLFGSDPFEDLAISRQAALTRLRQVLLNLVLRLRATYALERDKEERLAIVLADAAGPLRASAAEILVLEGSPAPSPREALERLAASWDAEKAGALMASIRSARETRRLEPGTAATTYLTAVDLAKSLHGRALTLS